MSPELPHFIEHSAQSSSDSVLGEAVYWLLIRLNHGRRIGSCVGIGVRDVFGSVIGSAVVACVSVAVIAVIWAAAHMYSGASSSVALNIA